MTRGKLIVIEGSDGAGKGTQLSLLVEYCKNHTIPYKTFDFPQYDKTFFGKMCEAFLEGNYGEHNSPYLISLPYAADRWKAKEQIEDNLSQGKLVLVNRYTPSNAAYQAAHLPKESRDAFIEWVFQLEYREFGIPKEDLVVYLHVPIEQSQNLLDIRGKKKDIYEQNLSLLKTTEELYGGFCEKFPHWFRVECAENGSILAKETIHAMIIAELTRRVFLM